MLGIEDNNPAPTAPTAVPTPVHPRGEASGPDPDSIDPAPQSPTLPIGERVLDLIARLLLIALSTVVFTVAGPAAFTAVTSVGLGLFATWRSNHSRPPRR